MANSNMLLMGHMRRAWQPSDCEPQRNRRGSRRMSDDPDGEFSLEEASALEIDCQVREGDTLKSKANRKEQHQRLLAWAYIEDGRKGFPPNHRLARRPWLADNFEKLPVMVCRRRAEHRQQEYKKSLEARIVFIGHLRDTYGNEVRAWRRDLDPDSSFTFTRRMLLRYIHSVDLKVDVNALWKSLDKDCDGIFRLEELCVRRASTLASFQAWVRENFDSCTACWDSPTVVLARSAPQRVHLCWASTKKMLLSAFGDALEELGWPGANNPIETQVVLSSLDYLGCGLLAKEDFEWLDKWEPLQWITAEPDHGAWEALRQNMLDIYQHPLRAWRNLLDQDNSNHVSWTEFKKACDALDFQGNRGGAWRSLDVDLNGYISMDEYDEPSAQLLGSFKEWAEKNFGSVELAFKTLDPSGVGVLSYQDLKRACHKLKWQGDVRLLFDFLDCAEGDDTGKRTISLKEVAFLDDWEDDPSPEQQAEEDVVSEALQKRAKPAKAIEPVIPWHSISQMTSSATMFKMESLDGLYKAHRRQAVVRTTSDSNLNKVAIKALGLGKMPRKKGELSEGASEDGREGRSFIANSFSYVFTEGRPATVPSATSLTGTAPLQNLRQPKPVLERMRRLNNAKNRNSPMHQKLQ